MLLQHLRKVCALQKKVDMGIRVTKEAMAASGADEKRILELLTE